MKKEKKEQKKVEAPKVVVPTPDPITLEFKGVSEASNNGNQKLFYIYDTTKASGTWVSLNDKNAPYLVSSYHGNSVMVNINGQQKEIRMKKSDGTVMEAMAPAPAKATTTPQTTRSRRSYSRSRTSISSSRRRRVVNSEN